LIILWSQAVAVAVEVATEQLAVAVLAVCAVQLMLQVAVVHCRHLCHFLREHLTQSQ
jgi:hypothetical protein